MQFAHYPNSRSSADLSRSIRDVQNFHAILYLQNGLLLGEHCILLLQKSDSGTPGAVTEFLKSSGFELKPYSESGAFRILQIADAYDLLDQIPESRNKSFWQKTIDEAKSLGRSAIRILAELDSVPAGSTKLAEDGSANAVESQYPVEGSNKQSSPDSQNLGPYAPSFFWERYDIEKSEASIPDLFIQASFDNLALSRKLAEAHSRLNEIIENHQRLEKQISGTSEQEKDNIASTAEGLEYKTITEALPGIVWSADSNGQTDYLNPYWFKAIGLSFDETKGHGWTSVLHPDDYERALNVWRHCCETGEPYAQEYRFRMADGSYRWHLTTGSYLKCSDEEYRWFGVCTDIDDQKRLAEELAASCEKAEAAARDKARTLAESAFKSGLTKSRLSVREYQVLELLAQGLNNQEIARALSIGSETLKTHMRHLMDKLEVADRTQAAVKALKEGLLVNRLPEHGSALEAEPVRKAQANELTRVSRKSLESDMDPDFCKDPESSMVSESETALDSDTIQNQE